MDFGTSLVAISGVLFGIGGPLVLVGMILWYKARRTKMIHETALKMADKGLPVPPELFTEPEDEAMDLRRGLVLVGLGLALSAFMYEIGKPWSIGLIPLFMGIGFLVVWKMESGKPAKKRD